MNWQSASHLETLGGFTQLDGQCQILPNFTF